MGLDQGDDIIKEHTVIFCIIVDVEDVDEVVVGQFDGDEHGILMDEEGVDGGVCVD